MSIPWIDNHDSRVFMALINKDKDDGKVRFTALIVRVTPHGESTTFWDILIAFPALSISHTATIPAASPQEAIENGVKWLTANYDELMTDALFLRQYLCSN